MFFFLFTCSILRVFLILRFSFYCIDVLFYIFLFLTKFYIKFVILVDHLAQSKVQMHHLVTPSKLHICHVDLMFSFQLSCFMLYVFIVMPIMSPQATPQPQREKRSDPSALV